MDHDQSEAKRPTTSQSQLLPPLELLSSSPALPNAGSSSNPVAAAKYPTPVPTSSTAILSSSPPRVAANGPVQRAPSISERAPLSAVPSVELNENGDSLLMGRSSYSSHYQLSANRLISRVHVKARYIPASAPLEPNKIEVECSGWNGLKLSCQGRTWDMAKGHVLTFDDEGADIMIDVQDARVLVLWPKPDPADDPLADLGWGDSPRSPSRLPSGGQELGLGVLQSSPLPRSARITSPVSPTPAHASQHSSILSDLPSVSDRERSVEIYEDQDADEPSSAGHSSTADQSFATHVGQSFSSDLSDPQSDGENGDEIDPDEENDPIIHSFGPYGANLNRRLASFSAGSPKRRRLDAGGFVSPKVDEPRRSKSASTPRLDTKASLPPQDHESQHEEPVIPDLSHVNVATITNHIVNQLAFSRLSSTPLSTLLSNLPAEDKHGLERQELKYIVESTTCIGTIPRQGKDADGKPLESQYYYVPEADTDQSRRAAVVDGLRKPTLRNCRKHHVVSHLFGCDHFLILPLTYTLHSNTTGNDPGHPRLERRHVNTVPILAKAAPLGLSKRKGKDGNMIYMTQHAIFPPQNTQTTKDNSRLDSSDLSGHYLSPPPPLPKNALHSHHLMPLPLHPRVTSLPVQNLRAYCYHTHFASLHSGRSFPLGWTSSFFFYYPVSVCFHTVCTHVLANTCYKEVFKQKGRKSRRPHHESLTNKGDEAVGC